MSSLTNQSSLSNCVAILANKLVGGLDRLQLLVSLGVRFWIANIFWTSGWLKFTSWQNTLMLYEYEHPVPYLPVFVAAFVGTAGELIFSAMLVFGFGTRIAALGLIVMTAVIEFTYQHHVEHVYWGMLLSVLLCYGPGLIALDTPIKRYFSSQK
jgi:putative oxidoreductase